jgi:predicted SprT family Zn-dependent metalloprotease
MAKHRHNSTENIKNIIDNSEKKEYKCICGEYSFVEVKDKGNKYPCKKCYLLMRAKK